MIIFNVPKSAKLIKTSTVFAADFNADPLNLGFYNFSYGTTNNNITILPTKSNTVYLIDRASFGGNMSQLAYQRSLINPVPYLTFYRVIGQEVIYQSSIPLSGYFQETEFTAFFTSDKNGDGIAVSLAGMLSQDVENIGLTTSILYLNLSIYAVDENEYNNNFRGSNNLFKV